MFNNELKYNNLYAKKFIKLTNYECCHNNYQFKEGLNIDIYPFNDKKNCLIGGIYFCRIEHAYLWLNYSGKKMFYVWDVEIPENEKIIDMGEKLKTNKIILYNKREIFNDENLCLELVKKNEFVFQFVKKQTPEICLEAVKIDGYLLKYIKEQTHEICMEAIKNYRLALEFVKEQTPEICLEAIKNYGSKYMSALQYVKNQTPEICLEAVKNDGTALQFVKEQTPEICLEAIKNNGLALKYVEKQTYELCLEAVKNNILSIYFIKNKTQNIYLDIIRIISNT